MCGNRLTASARADMMDVLLEKSNNLDSKSVDFSLRFCAECQKLVVVDCWGGYILSIGGTS